MRLSLSPCLGNLIKIVDDLKALLGKNIIISLRDNGPPEMSNPSTTAQRSGLIGVTGFGTYNEFNPKMPSY